ncbi:transposase (fragment) [Thiomonas arsenitoxydans]|uniref:Transposase n=1 Tax=Thiomonas arsenitoxydans (strain DSM 22701 / CIP 110005 / 3As) TaxID=426114 RepID=A0ABP1Z173_THIA3
MFLKISSSGGHRYVRLVESFRNADGQPRQRTNATLGRLDEQGGPLDALLRAKGRPSGDSDPSQVRFESALALGDVWALDALWHELGFHGLGAIFRRARFTTAVEHAIRVMVFNRLCDPESKLGVLRWLQTVSMPGIDVDKLSSHSRQVVD